MSTEFTTNKNEFQSFVNSDSNFLIILSTCKKSGVLLVKKDFASKFVMSDKIKVSHSTLCDAWGYKGIVEFVPSNKGVRPVFQVKKIPEKKDMEVWEDWLIKEILLTDGDIEKLLASIKEAEKFERSNRIHVIVP